MPRWAAELTNFRVAQYIAQPLIANQFRYKLDIIVVPNVHHLGDQSQRELKGLLRRFPPNIPGGQSL
ncbi:MAG: hypothetical protein G3I08_06910 [Ferrovum sp.]|nr:hypothetical protein [Ferrovum sp.]